MVGDSKGEVMMMTMMTPIEQLLRAPSIIRGDAQLGFGVDFSRNGHAKFKKLN